MKERLDILFLSGWYPNRVNPTLGNFVQKHAEAVALYDHVTALNITSDASCKDKYEITDQVVNGVRTINVYYKKVETDLPFISQIQKIRRYLHAFRLGISAAGGARKFDLVHHNILYPFGILAWRIKKKYGIPYLITEHSTGYLPSKHRKTGVVEKIFSKIIARNAACITPVTADLQKAMISHSLDSKYRIVYNVMDTRLFFPAEKKNATEKIKLLHISTLDDSHKNITGMLKVLARLAGERNDFSAAFVGDGNIEPHIATANKLGLSAETVSFGGTRTTAEVAELMREADCFMMFSNYENLPCVIVEALATGLPVVSSSVGGIPEHIGADEGVLVAPGDEQALYSALQTIISNIREGRYDQQKLSKYARENFSYENTGRKFHELYQCILARKEI